ncbi:hypothetical protein AB0M92_28920 [Streptomyces sp. NPDC051582]|uniref:hypothetical protein n=1 Tax=Streptomyces sp. NPDC051582 TaxID=3155167 RepID=UPI00342DC3C9
MNLRLIGISAGVLIILSLPLAGAIAGPDFTGQDDGKGGGLLSSLGLADPAGGSRTPASAAGAGRRAGPPRPGQPGRPPAEEPQPGPSEQPRTDSRCGPELSSPQGLEAQTCVLAGEGRTWGRSYYRNTSGRALDAVLTVMGPAGRTVQIRCAVGAGDEPGLCETPREDSAGAPDAYSAVAEFAVPDDEGQLLLRSGSNSPAPADG